MTITVNKDPLLSKYLKIYINGILHLAICRDRLDNVQSWISKTNETSVYYLELFYKNGTKVMVEYNNSEKFNQVMKLIDDNLD